ncbi:MAG: hypothetical protein JNN26_27185, partial [Candidatus Obscuribacter sp.]|nr:hypothetical protein [Candidatus Obscuribacter sp.]
DDYDDGNALYRKSPQKTSSREQRTSGRKRAARSSLPAAVASRTRASHDSGTHVQTAVTRSKRRHFDISVAAAVGLRRKRKPPDR